jgi:hypothetical protein
MMKELRARPPVESVREVGIMNLSAKKPKPEESISVDKVKGFILTTQQLIDHDYPISSHFLPPLPDIPHKKICRRCKIVTFLLSNPKEFSFDHTNPDMVIEKFACIYHTGFFH